MPARYGGSRGRAPGGEEAMKKILIYAAIAVAVLAAWFIRDAMLRSSAAKSVQADPEKAVASFMSTMAKLTALVYEKSQRDELESDVDELEAKGEEATKDDVADICEKYGLESQAPLFLKEKTGKSIMAAFLIVRFEEFEIINTKIDGDEATVSAKFRPLDILGLGALTEKLGAPTPQTQREPMPMTFVLERRRYRWYITDMKGKLGDFSRILSR